MLRSSARDSLAHWLTALPWDVFVTITDAGMAHPETISKRHRYLVHRVNDSLYGKRWHKRTAGVEYVVGIERQRRGAAHAHAMWRFPDHDPSDVLVFPRTRWQAFASNLGGFSRIEAVRSSGDVADYVTKYILKDGEIEFSQGFDPNKPRGRADVLDLGTRSKTC